jgi:hypothetical protein
MADSCSAASITFALCVTRSVGGERGRTKTERFVPEVLPPSYSRSAGPLGLRAGAGSVNGQPENSMSALHTWLILVSSS